MSLGATVVSAYRDAAGYSVANCDVPTAVWDVLATLVDGLQLPAAEACGLDANTLASVFNQLLEGCFSSVAGHSSLYHDDVVAAVQSALRDDTAVLRAYSPNLTPTDSLLEVVRDFHKRPVALTAVLHARAVLQQPEAAVPAAAYPEAYARIVKVLK